MKYYSKLFAFFVTLSILLLGACSDYEDTVTPSPTVQEGNPALRFASNNDVFEVDPAGDLSISVTVMRDNGVAAGDYPIEVVTNTENSFIVPSSVSFAAGAETVVLKIGISPSAPTGVDLSLEITFPDEFVNPYKVNYANYHATTSVVLWESLGICQFSDSWTLYSVSEVELFYSPDKKQYRFTNPYTEELLLEAEWENWIGGPQNDYIYFTMTEDKKLQWNFWYLGLNYQAVEGQPIKAYFPSALNASYAEEDELSQVSPDDDKLFIFYPRFYIDGVGGYGLQTCYLSLPGGSAL
jgi:hypothetical protein